MSFHWLFSFTFGVVVACCVISVNCQVFRRIHEESEARNVIVRDPNLPIVTTLEEDVITVENYLRTYRHGSHEDQFILHNHDVFAAYVGPFPKEHPIPTSLRQTSKGKVRTWAMFDKTTLISCDLNEIYDWGQLALFSCSQPGVYQAYAIETDVDDMLNPLLFDCRDDHGATKCSLAWLSRFQKEPYNLLTSLEHKAFIVSGSNDDKITSPKERMKAIAAWARGDKYVYVGQAGNSDLQEATVVSDPVRIKETYFCYYWMYYFREIARHGYVGHEPVPPIFMKSDQKKKWTTYIMFELAVWIAEPSAVGLYETSDSQERIRVSHYSKVVTNRYSETGLFPCLRKAHPSIEVVKAFTFITENDPTNYLTNTPHWRGVIKVHTDRLISTLTDVTFTIASRQNAASFHCFVGATRVFLVLRRFEFVPLGKLQPEDINLNVSNVYVGTKHEFIFDQIPVYGHGVHYIGAKWSKKFQPASQRSDMTVIPNPCLVQEFAFAVGGSLYMAEGLLRRGTENANKVYLPYFPNHRFQTENHIEAAPKIQEYLRIFDVAFTPTHVAFMFSDGYVLLHTSSASKKGVAEITQTMKYRPDQFVKRRWCPRTYSQKLSAMMLPIYGEKGNIIILQVYPTEGNVQVILTPPSSSCLPEGSGYVKKLEELTNLVNETDIHYDDFAKVKRTNHKTGLLEPPIPPRSPARPQTERNIFDEVTFLLDSSRNFVIEGEDPHFPLKLINPASHVLEPNLEDYNKVKIYIVAEADEQSSRGMANVLQQNGLHSLSDVTISDVQFTAAEKQFVFGMRFKAPEIADNFQRPPFQMMVSTFTVTNFPYIVKMKPNSVSSPPVLSDEKLETVVPFPGVILLRMKPYKVAVVKSRDPLENMEHTDSLRGSTEVDFMPQIHTLGTALPSYIINLGDVIVYSSIENRYARPLHFFPWKVLREATNTAAAASLSSTKAVVEFRDSTILFAANRTLFDVLVTEQGLISLLWRKSKRHLVQDDEDCLVTPDADVQTVVMGSVMSLEGLREVKPFFRNDNIFQSAMPDGAIVYGVYDVKPRSAFDSCPDNNDTYDDLEPCVKQPTDWKSKRQIKVCTKDEEKHDTPCRDSAYLEYCTNATQPATHACLLASITCPADDTLRIKDEGFTPPQILDDQICDNNFNQNSSKMTPCMPKHAPREDLRTMHITGVSYHSYLQGSLESVRTMHSEASEDPDEVLWEAKEEPDICPFVKFQVYHRNIDFAEVGYQLRVTAQVSYIGTGIPAEADLLVEYERTMGVVVEISTSIEEIRDMSSIYKAVDIYFHMPDYMLQELIEADPAEKHHHRALKFDFDDIRAREKFVVFSLTFRPSIVNTRCKSAEFFKTIQFNVGCNTFTSIRLMSEVTALKPINWTDSLKEKTGYQWHRDYQTGNLTIPKLHIYYKQLKSGIFNCDKNPNYCFVPYFHLFKNEIYTLSFKDLLQPQFEQFLSLSSRPVSGNVVIYDLLGSKNFNWTLSKYKARCRNLAHSWYDKLLFGTQFIGGETFEHENVYYYYKDCFDEKETGGEEDRFQDLLTTPFYFFNRTNKNSLKFNRNRNQIFIFRAVVLNTYYNRFTYCRQLDTFFMVRIAGIPIPRQGLGLWQYVLILLLVAIGFVIWYFIFARFYTWTVRIPTAHSHGL